METELTDLVTFAEIARRLKISRQRVHQLSSDKEFPASIGSLGNYNVYSWREVAEWARARGRIA